MTYREFAKNCLPEPLYSEFMKRTPSSILDYEHLHIRSNIFLRTTPLISAFGWNIGEHKWLYLHRLIMEVSSKYNGPLSEYQSFIKEKIKESDLCR